MPKVWQYCCCVQGEAEARVWGRNYMESVRTITNLNIVTLGEPYSIWRM